MSEDWGLEIEDDVVATPIEVQDIKLFGKGNPDEVQVRDISLTDYISVKEKHAVYLPHTAGRYAVKRFRKAQCPIVERLTNSLMMHGRNNGKKLMTVRIIRQGTVRRQAVDVSPLRRVNQAIWLLCTGAR